jgi:hypothetical protein
MTDGKYNVTAQQNTEIEALFEYRKPNDSQKERNEAIRESGKLFALTIAKNTPKSADQSAAFRYIRNATFSAIEAVKLEEKETVGAQSGR